ncbi:MAG: amino acid ABC transporter ATP-binding protein [Pseudolabrys sp.]
MIDLRGISKSFGQNKVLRGCDLTVARGEVVVICGRSGSGKSTLIKCINGLVPHDTGEIRIEGHLVGGKAGDWPKLRAKIGMVFQHFELYSHMSALANVALAQIHVLHRSRAEAEERSRRLLQRVGLLDKANAMPANLSGGEQQRVAIARALALDPAAILFDEPTSALDPEMISEVLDVMIELAGEGMTMVVVTHEMGFARRVAGRIVFMDKGEILEDVPTERFFTAPKTSRAQEFLSKLLSH